MIDLRYLSPLDPNIVRLSSLALRRELALAQIVDSNQGYRFHVMMGEMTYAATIKEAVRILKPKRR